MKIASRISTLLILALFSLPLYAMTCPNGNYNPSQWRMLGNPKHTATGFIKATYLAGSMYCTYQAQIGAFPGQLISLFGVQKPKVGNGSPWHPDTYGTSCQTSLSTCIFQKSH